MDGQWKPHALPGTAREPNPDEIVSSAPATQGEHSGKEKNRGEDGKANRADSAQLQTRSLIPSASIRILYF
jgi:hypothetical protein